LYFFYYQSITIWKLQKKIRFSEMSIKSHSGCKEISIRFWTLDSGILFIYRSLIPILLVKRYTQKVLCSNILVVLVLFFIYWPSSENVDQFMRIDTQTPNIESCRRHFSDFSQYVDLICNINVQQLQCIQHKLPHHGEWTTTSATTTIWV